MAISTLSPAPAVRRMLAAQFLALLAGFPLALALIFPVGAALNALLGAGLNSNLHNLVSSFSMYFIQALTLAALQLLVMRSAVTRPLLWLLGSGLLGVVLLPGLFPLTARLVFSIAAPNSQPWMMVLLCGGIGLVLGLALAVVQSVWMNAGRVRWMVVSSLTCGLAWAAAFPALYTVLYIHP